MTPRASLDAVAKRRNQYPCRESNLGRPTYSCHSSLIMKCKGKGVPVL